MVLEFSCDDIRIFTKNMVLKVKWRLNAGATKW